LFASTSLSSPGPPNPFLLAADILDPPQHAYRHDPVGYARDVLRFEAWSKQAEIMRAVLEHHRVAVRSSHGPGKTATAAQIVLWFLRVFRNSRVITTAPTWAQVEQLLWREIRAGVARATPDEFPAASATKLELGVEWFAIGLSTNEPERFQGHHADNLLLVVDEASGVDERIFEAAEGFLTAEGAHMLLVGNPTRVGGQFHRAFTTERAQWRTIHISTEDTPNYTGEQVSPEVARSLPRKEWMQEKAAAWGVDSPMYQVRVLGNFPAQASDAVINLHEVEMAQRRDHPTRVDQQLVVIACDVARFGDDETVIGTRIGQQVRIRESFNGKDTTVTTGHLMRLVREYGPQCRVVIDDDGVGGGVTDQVREKLREGDPMLRDVNVTGFKGGASPFVEDDYPNRRSELWFAMADALPELDLDPDEQLAADLTSPTYKLDSRGRRVVEPKQETKKRLGRSPDRGDMALLTLVPAGADVVSESTRSAPAPASAADWASEGMNPATERW
jgi:phage terminase large subunit